MVMCFMLSLLIGLLLRSLLQSTPLPLPHLLNSSPALRPATTLARHLAGNTKVEQAVAA
jgi:hypothetical protein